ncbi:MAG TPA: serine hydrolase domain-containing protein [Longimicrobium sp.]|nr:serine hydrolase domain-containing protein [Longimicrobium sp.]
MRPIGRSVFAISALLCACAPHAQSSHPSTLPSAPADVLAMLDAQAPRWLAEHGVPSLAVAYVHDGQVAWTRVYGEQSQGVPATDSTLYNIASLTKPVFAELVLRLAADGRLSLDESMAPHWTDPDVAADPRHQAFTPRLALSHQLGFTNWRRETEGVLRIGFDPGTQFRYSGEGYEYARRFTENKMGASLDSLARQYVFGPLGMRSTAFTRQPWFAGRMAIPKGPEGRWGDPSVYDTANAADDIHTTVGDYARFIAAAMEGDGLPAALAAQRDSIHATGVEKCDPAKVRVCPARIGYGLGWTLFEYADPAENVRWHTGGDWGEKTIAFYWPGRREGVVMFTNGANGFSVMVPAAVLLAEGTLFQHFLRDGG